jgi:hypothetical protein
MNETELVGELNVQRDIWLHGGEVASNIAYRALNGLLEQMFEILPITEGHYDE